MCTCAKGKFAGNNSLKLILQIKPSMLQECIIGTTDLIGTVLGERNWREDE